MRARVGGQGGGHRRLLESDRNWQESDNAFRTPCTPKGGGGFNKFRPTRRHSNKTDKKRDMFQNTIRMDFTVAVKLFTVELHMALSI